VFQLLRYIESGLTVDGKFIPPGAPVGISPIAQRWDSKIRGDDVDESQP